VSYVIANNHQDPSVNAIVESLEDNKAEKISIISLKGKAEFAEFMVVAFWSI
jgi:ribosomal silencing factor RsfS